MALIQDIPQRSLVKGLHVNAYFDQDDKDREKKTKNK